MIWLFWGIVQNNVVLLHEDWHIYILRDHSSSQLLVHVHAHTCISMWFHPLKYRKPSSSHILNKEWFSLTQQLSALSSSSVRSVAWRSSACLCRDFCLAWSCTGCVWVTLATINWCTQKACHVQKTAFYSTIPRPLAHAFFAHLFQQCLLTLSGGGFNIDVPFRAQRTFSLILKPINTYTIHTQFPRKHIYWSVSFKALHYKFWTLMFCLIFIFFRFWALLLTFKYYNALIGLVFQNSTVIPLYFSVSVVVLVTVQFGFVHMASSLIKQWSNNALFVRYLTQPLLSTDLELNISEFSRTHCS